MTSLGLRRPDLPLLAMLLAATDVALGAVYILEPRTRTLSPGLSAARDLMPIWAWGAVILAVGIIAILAICYQKHPTVMMSLGVGWHLFFTLSLVLSAIDDPRAGLGGCVIFTSFTLLHLLASRQR